MPDDAAQQRSLGHIVIAGAGPAGIVAAMSAAQLGYQVDVFERRPRPTEANRLAARTYPMALSSRSVDAIRAVGASLPMLDPDSFMEGVMAAATGKVIARMSSPPDSSSSGNSGQLTFLVDQVGLCLQLLTEAERLFGSRITFHFSRQLQLIDFDKRVATFSSSSSSSSDGQPSGTSPGQQQQSAAATAEDGAAATSIDYDLFVGADGASSRTRALLQEALPGFSANTLINSNRHYKTVKDLPGGPQEPIPGFASHRPRQFLYIFGARGKAHTAAAPRLVLWKTEAGTAAGMAGDEIGWDPESIKAGIRRHYPSVPDAWCEAIAAQTGPGQAPASFGKLMTVSSMAGRGCVILLGDSAHPMTSTLGQGCNTALDSVSAFRRCLTDITITTSGGGGPVDLSGLPAAINAVRLPDVRAMQRLEYLSACAMPNAVKNGYCGRLQHIRAVFMFASVTLVGLVSLRAKLLLAAAAAAFGGSKGARSSSSNSSSDGAKVSRNRSTNVNLTAPWMTQLRDSRVPMRQLLAQMTGQSRLAGALLAAAAAALAFVARKAASAVLAGG